MRTRSGSRLVAVAATCAACAVVCLVPNRALASGFDLPQVGSAQSGPVTRDAAALHHNPGQLGFLGRGEVMISGGAIVADIRYQRNYLGTYQLSDTLQFDDPIDPAYIDPNKTGLAKEVSTTPVGPAGGLFFALPLLEKRLAMGLGVAVPYAAVLDFPEDGAQRFAVRDAFVASTNITAALAVRLHDKVSLGAGVAYVLTFMSLSKVQDFAAVDDFHDALAEPPVNQDNDFGVDAPSTVRELDVLARPVWIQDGISHGITFNAGLAIRPTDRFDLAIAYNHGSRVRANGTFTLDMNDDFFTQDLAAEGLQYPPVVEGDATIEFRLPMRVTLGLGYDISDKFRLDGFASYVFYQVVDQFDITLDSEQLAQPKLGVPGVNSQVLPRDWKGVVNVELNGRIRPTERVLLSVMLGYNSPASPDETIDTASPDGHRMLWGLGFGYMFGQRFQLLVDSKLHHMIPREVTDSTNDLGNGTYKLFIGQFGLSARVFFDYAGAKPAKRKKASAAAPQPAENPTEN